jgi:hypothetical protein
VCVIYIYNIYLCNNIYYNIYYIYEDIYCRGVIPLGVIGLTHTHPHTHKRTPHTHTHTHTHTQDGRTALHEAARRGHGGVAEALLKAGCNKNMQDTV